MATKLEKYKVKVDRQARVNVLSDNVSKDIKIVMEGDSWFKYPIKKEITYFLQKMGYPIRCIAKHGDTFENMIYGTEYEIRGDKVFHDGNLSFQLTMNEIRSIKPKFFLFSAGGNDIVGPDLINFLNHERMHHTEPFRKAEFDRFVDVYMRRALEFYFKAVWAIDPNIHIIMDGYDYAIPNGKAYKLVGINLSGPWILPSMGKKAIGDPDVQKDIIRKMVDKFNNLLEDFDVQYDQFHHIDLRNQNPDPKDWDNEIHLSADGFERAAIKYHEKMTEINRKDGIDVIPMVERLRDRSDILSLPFS